MARTRALVALSAIFIVPLAASLVVHHQQMIASAPEPTAEPAHEPAVAPPPAPEPVSMPEPEPEPAPVLDPTAIVRDPGEAMLLHDGALVVSTDVASSWASGRLTLTAEPGRLAAQRSVSWDRLPDSARGLADAAVVVYAGDGSACVATVSAPRLHLERTGEAFPGTPGSDDEGYETFEVPSDLRVLRRKVKALFEVASDRLLLVTQRAHDRRPCRGVWARRADLPAPRVFGRRALRHDDVDALASSALPVIRAQPEFTALAVSYAEHLRELEPRRAAREPDWDTFVATNLVVTRWDEVGGPRQVVSVELRLDREPCTDAFSGGLALLLEQGSEGLTRLPQSGMFDLSALMDIDRDGTLEGVTDSIYGEHTIEAEGPRAATFADTFMIEYFGCPC